MMFIFRERDGAGLPEAVKGSVKLTRPTPSYADSRGGTDHFFVADKEVADALASEGHEIVRLRDGWYEAGEGGVAIWTDGLFWEIRDTTFTVAEICPL